LSICNYYLKRQYIVKGILYKYMYSPNIPYNLLNLYNNVSINKSSVCYNELDKNICSVMNKHRRPQHIIEIRNLSTLFLPVEIFLLNLVKCNLCGYLTSASARSQCLALIFNSKPLLYWLLMSGVFINENRKKANETMISLIGPVNNSLLTYVFQPSVLIIHTLSAT